MPYITREDGERFIIPSYRDTLSAKKQSLLKKEILLLSQDYGEYITLQRKNITQYEVAFSQEPGYLLGETVWHYFKRPFDLIYCEAIPNSSEAILVVVKSGSVYLDGSFPVDSIPEELVVFRTQQNQFDIYIQGDVPISKELEDGKFSLAASSVRSFNVLPDRIFPVLPTIKTFQLQLVETVLTNYGIGVFPIKKVLATIIFLGLLWMGYTYLSINRKELPSIPVILSSGPYDAYLSALTSPNPRDEMQSIARQIQMLYSIPGWYPVSMTYASGQLKALMMSPGVKTNLLFDWASQHHATVDLEKDGFYLVLMTNMFNRMPPAAISPMTQVVAVLLDRVANVISGNTISLDTITNKGRYQEVTLKVTFSDVSPATFALLGNQFAQLPLILSSVKISVESGNVSGTINLKALGN